MFALPFGLFVAGISGLGIVLAVFGDMAAFALNPTYIFDLATSPEVAFGTLAYGLVVLGIALYYDFQDPHRLLKQFVRFLAAPACGTGNRQLYVLFHLERHVGNECDLDSRGVNPDCDFRAND